MRTRTKVFIGIFLVLLIALCVLGTIYLWEPLRVARINLKYYKEIIEHGYVSFTETFLRFFSFCGIILILWSLALFSLISFISLFFKRNIFFLTAYACRKYTTQTKEYEQEKKTKKTIQKQKKIKKLQQQQEKIKKELEHFE